MDIEEKIERDTALSRLERTEEGSSAARAEVERLRQWQTDCREAMAQAEAREEPMPQDLAELRVRHMDVLQAFRIAHGFYEAEKRRGEKREGELSTARAENTTLRAQVRDLTRQLTELRERSHTEANRANDKVLLLELENRRLGRLLSPPSGEGLTSGYVQAEEG